MNRSARQLINTFPLTNHRVRGVNALIALLLTMLCLLPTLSIAQWSGDGVRMIDFAVDGADGCPDGQGGAWYAQNRGPYYEQSVIVQHIDSEGYLAFGQNGLQVAPDPYLTLWGIEPCLNGDCIVMYSWGREEGGEYIRDLFAQRITQEGDLLWGEYGIDISVTDTPHTIPVDFNGGWTASDGTGGLWGLWRWSSGSMELFICGVNADGTLKYPDQDLYLATSIMNLDCRFVEDGAGGVTVMFGNYADGQLATRHILVQRVLADGSTLYDEPQLVMDWPADNPNGRYFDPYHIRRDPEGGYILTSHSRWQRISDDLVPQWEIQGVLVYNWDPPFYNLDYQSNPVVMADRSVIQLCTNSEFSSPYLEQVMLDGTRRLGDDWGPYAGDTTYSQLSPGPDFPSPDAQSLISITRCNLQPGGNNFAERIQRLTQEGSNLWNQITSIDPESTDMRTSGDNMAFYVDDNHILYYLANLNILDRRFYAFKLSTSDGSIAGTTSVSEHPDNGLPPDQPAFIVTAYPNPFNSTTTLEFAVRQPGVYELVMVNVLGRVVDQRSLELAAGTQRHEIAAPDGWPSGIYFVQLRQGDTAFSARKVLLLR